ncbi:energy transducer TonB [Aquimarina megaterium]|uniref:hypothetical protein n=1 Tax=Aquimarina megaterium TaxID=1443666 RepID=UPI0004B7B8B9|nr:hypothetical protein [Aquimarina megaterium]
MRSFLVLLFGLMIFSASFSQNNPILKCKDSTNERIRQNCIITVIQEFVDANYNIAEITPYAKPGTNRVYVRFKIDQIGRIVDIQAKSSSMELELEAIKTLQSFPYTIPKSEKTSSKEKEVFEDVYTLPIVFEVQTTEINLSSQKRITGND